MFLSRTNNKFFTKDNKVNIITNFYLLFFYYQKQSSVQFSLMFVDLLWQCIDLSVTYYFVEAKLIHQNSVLFCFFFLSVLLYHLQRKFDFFSRFFFLLEVVLFLMAMRLALLFYADAIKMYLRAMHKK